MQYYLNEDNGYGIVLVGFGGNDLYDCNKFAKIHPKLITLWIRYIADQESYMLGIHSGLSRTRTSKEYIVECVRREFPSTYLRQDTGKIWIRGDSDMIVFKMKLMDDAS